MRFNDIVHDILRCTFLWLLFVWVEIAKPYVLSAVNNDKIIEVNFGENIVRSFAFEFYEIIDDVLILAVIEKLPWFSFLDLPDEFELSV